MNTKTCETCQSSFLVKAYRAAKARFCSTACMGAWMSTQPGASRPRPDMRGNAWRKGRPPANPFAGGHTPWNRGMKGIRLSPASEFQKGAASAKRVVVGSEKTRIHRGVSRVWVKTGEPSTWKLRAVVVWEATHGPVPDGCVVHHADHDPMNDACANLQMLTRADHARHHNKARHSA